VRPLLAGLCLAVLAASEVRTLSPAEALRRLTLARRLVSGGAIAPGERTGFYFDPEYASFLDEVARRTPRDATVAVLVPERPDLYRVQAVYALAPRRIVDEPLAGEAGWLAVWGPRRASVADGLPIGRDGVLMALPRSGSR
jgi:hypothetical protein